MQTGEDMASEENMTFGELMDYRSKNYFLIYIDVLGYQDFKNINGNKELYASLEKTRMLAYKIFSPKVTMKDGSSPDFKIDIKMYTDNILLSVELKDDEYDILRCSVTLVLFARFLAEVLKECHLQLRGAVTCGKCDIEHFIFGDPYLEAHNLESKSAVWSRIMFSENVLEKYVDPAIKEKIVRRDERGLPFLDYLRSIIEFSLGNRDGLGLFVKEHYDSVMQISKNTFQKDRIFKVHSLRGMVYFRRITENIHKLSMYHNAVCDDYGLEDLKLPVVDATNTFLEDYENFIKVWDKTDHKNTENLRMAFDKLLESYETVCNDLERDLKLYSDIEKLERERIAKRRV